MTEFSPEQTPRKKGALRRLAGRVLGRTVEMPGSQQHPSQSPVELTLDGVPKSIKRITTIDPTGEKPAVTRTYRNW
ncbi:MAG TPA: hypothetical protein VGE34_00470 [Candidatus Saccharimonadales bacterium]